MSKQLKTIFENLIQKGKGKKEIVYECPGCGAKIVAMRRDITFVIVSFMLVLRDWEAEGRGEYHHYRQVIAEAQKRYNCTPSDYSILQRWGLIESKPGVNTAKYKRLTDKGKLFLEDKLMVKSHHYQIPHTETVLFCKDTTNFSLLRMAWLEKNERKPFFDENNSKNI